MVEKNMGNFVSQNSTQLISTGAGIHDTRENKYCSILVTKHICKALVLKLQCQSKSIMLIVLTGSTIALLTSGSSITYIVQDVTPLLIMSSWFAFIS